LALEGELGQLREGLLDVKVRFGARLHEKHVTLLLAKLLELLMRDGSLLSLEVELVRDHQEGEGVRLIDHALREECVLPVEDVLERLLVGQVIDKQAAVSPTIEGCAKRLVAFLAGRVPDLKSHKSPGSRANLLVAEVSADGRLEALCELAILEHLNERGLADAGVADSDDLDEALLHLRGTATALRGPSVIHLSYSYYYIPR
jgi:hypothetical protein